MENQRDRLRTDLMSLGLDVSSERLEQLNKFIEEIELWNPIYKLISREEDLINRHVLDCLAGVNIIRSIAPQRLADVGSGGGFPGVLLAIWMEDTQVCLIERSGRRAKFLRDIGMTLNLSNLSIIESPVEKVSLWQSRLKSGMDALFDVITFRAWSAINSDILDSLEKILAPGGTIAAYKGRRVVIDAEIAGINQRLSACEISKLVVPGLQEERHLVLLKLS